jgi:hypothetical protein
MVTDCRRGLTPKAMLSTITSNDTCAASTLW